MQREVCPRNRIDRLVANNGQEGSLDLAPLKTLHMPYHAPGIRGGLLRVIFVVRALLIVRGDCLAVLRAIAGSGRSDDADVVAVLADGYASLRAMIDEYGQRRRRRCS